MSLVEKHWTPVSLHSVVLAWLRAERESRIAPTLSQRADWPAIVHLLTNPDLNNTEQNRARLRLLYVMRNVFVGEIPPDTKWYEVRNLTDNELPELHAVNFPEWTEPADRNELHKVAARKKIPLRGSPADWESPILWGHNRKGPFSIFEGNNRLTAYAGSGQSRLDIPVLVGLSPLSCTFHILDNCGAPLLYDLWKGT